MVRILLLIALIVAGHMARAGGLTGTFASIDGGTLSVEDWRGQPVLIVNTASQCGFTPQYEGLQEVWDTYRDQGLVVLAVPSDDFNQELSSAAKVKEFCELTYGLDFPMTDITHVKGRKAHPFFQQVKAETGFEPAWNFNKILVGRDGAVVATFGSVARPNSQKVLSAIETALN
ncbi:glutathione peroxidase [Falsiphaeobacter marinintestinus]|uniref:glutathione peroxidase n=1 Tax=Falsiphaeobacter marinintestinus TaxID=1492905 RepID=UPI0011B85747|nr:glutathione peroxidase [Phaeobacter marinintestinus]